MTNRPADVRIDDLFDPVFPEGVGPALEAMEAQAEGLDWTSKAIWAAAEATTGLTDRGPSLGNTELELLVAAGARGERLSGSGRVNLHSSLVHNASQKLLIVDYLSRHREVHDIEIERPIIIAGQARTGTTHLHNLLAADPALRSLEYWESNEPVPPVGEQGPAQDIDPRFTRTEQKLAGLNYTVPHFKRMHDMYAAHIHEEIQLMMPAFGCMLWDSTTHDDAIRGHYLATDQTPWYEWLKTVLKVCTHIGGGERWVLKSPQHVEQLAPIMSVFPDATVVCTHRDPVAVCQSIGTMMGYVARMSAKGECLKDVGQYWVHRIEQMFGTYAADRDLVPAEQSIDVRFDEFMADDIAMVERIYALADQPFTNAVRDHMDAFMDAHPRGKHGRVLYDLGQFDLDAAGISLRTKSYADRFGIAPAGS